jgi:hypothetical protein
VDTEDEMWQPTVEHLRSVLGMAGAVNRGDSVGIRTLMQGMTLYEGAMSCFALTQLLLARLADLVGKSVQDLVVQLSLELGSDVR